jgi:hypothetical protein
VVLVVPAVDSRVGHDEVLHREQPGAVGETDLAWLSLRFARPDSFNDRRTEVDLGLDRMLDD